MTSFDKYLKIKQDYSKYSFRVCNETTFCLLKEKEIYYNITSMFRNNNVDLFDLLHEIGHLETNTEDMKRYEQEFLATQWAIKHMNKYGIKVSKQRRKQWQDYIDQWRETSLKLKGKNVWSKEKCKLNWDFN